MSTTRTDFHNYALGIYEAHQRLQDAQDEQPEARSWYLEVDDGTSDWFDDLGELTATIAEIVNGGHRIIELSTAPF